MELRLKAPATNLGQDHAQAPQVDRAPESTAAEEHLRRPPPQSLDLRRAVGATGPRSGIRLATGGRSEEGEGKDDNGKSQKWKASQRGQAMERRTKKHANCFGCLLTPAGLEGTAHVAQFGADPIRVKRAVRRGDKDVVRLHVRMQ